MKGLTLQVLTVIWVKFLIATSRVYQLGKARELRTWSLKLNSLDISTASPHYFCKECMVTIKENWCILLQKSGILILVAWWNSGLWNNKWSMTTVFQLYMQWNFLCCKTFHSFPCPWRRKCSNPFKVNPREINSFKPTQVTLLLWSYRCHTTEFIQVFLSFISEITAAPLQHCPQRIETELHLIPIKKMPMAPTIQSFLIIIQVKRCGHLHFKISQNQSQGSNFSTKSINCIHPLRQKVWLESFLGQLSVKPDWKAQVLKCC